MPAENPIQAAQLAIEQAKVLATQSAVDVTRAIYYSGVTGNINKQGQDSVYSNYLAANRAYEQAQQDYGTARANILNLVQSSSGAGGDANSKNPDGTSKYAQIRQADGSYAAPTRAQGGLSPTFANNPDTFLLGNVQFAKAEEAARYLGDTPNAQGVLQYNPNNYLPIQAVYNLSQPNPGAGISSRIDVASNIQSVLDPKTGLYSANPNYITAYNPNTQPYGGSAFNIATELSGKGAIDSNLAAIARYQGFGAYNNGTPVERAPVGGGGGGAAYDIAMATERTGGQMGVELMKKAVEQGYVPGGSIAVLGDRSTVPIRDLSSGMGGRNVPMGYEQPDNRTYMPIGALAAQEREGTKVVYSPGGGFNIAQLIPSTQAGFTRIYPMITGGGSDYSLQSGMIAGKALTPQVYDQYGMNALWTPDKASLIAEMQVHPERFSRQGAELYGGKVERLDNRTMQDQFTKGTITTMPGRYAPETMNYAMLPGLLSPNTPKQFTGTDKLPQGASLTFAEDPIFQIVDAKTGEMKGVTPNWEPVKQNVVPREQPEFIMVRPADVARNYTPLQPLQTESQKYQPQIGGFIINAPSSFNMTQEVAEKKAYDANAAMLWADRQNKETFKSQTWMEPQPWQLVKNPLYQTPEQKAEAAKPTTFMGMNVVSLEKVQPSAPSEIALGYTPQTPNLYPGDGKAHDQFTFGIPGAAAFNRGVISSWDASPQFSPAKNIEALANIPSTFVGAFMAANTALAPTTKPVYGYTNQTIGVSGSNQTIQDLRASIEARQPWFASQYTNLNAQEASLKSQQSDIEALAKGNVTAGNVWSGDLSTFSTVNSMIGKATRENAAYNTSVSDYMEKNKVFSADVALYNAMDKQNPQVTTVRQIANVATNTTPWQATEAGGMYWTKGGMADDIYTKAADVYGSIPAPMRLLGVGMTTTMAGGIESVLGTAAPFVLPTLALPVTAGVIIGGVGVYAAEVSGRLGLTGKTDQYSVRTAGEQFGATPLGQSILSPFMATSEVPTQPVYSERSAYAAPSEIAARPVYSEIPNYKTVTDVVVQKQWSGIELPAYAIAGYTDRGFGIGETPVAYRNPNQMTYAEKLVNENPTRNDFAYPLGNPFVYNPANPNANQYENPNRNIFENPNPNQNPFAVPFANPLANPNANPYGYPNPTMPGQPLPRIDFPKIIIPPLPSWGGSGGGSFGGAKASSHARVTDIYRYGQGIGSFGFTSPINFGAPRGRKR